MNVFKRKSIYLAVAAGLGAVGMVGTASAVNVNSNGTGEVLIYPYYSVRGGTDTYLSVVNTTNSAKAVKVRFTEGKNSREVLDFNLYLSARDMWTGAVVATTDGAKLVTTDKSCTYPKIPATGQAFVNYAYTGSTVTPGIVSSGGDGAGQTLDRTREGYFEIIEMGVITSPAVVTAVTHTSAGVPANCAVVQTDSMTMHSAGTNPVVAPSGGLAGTASMLNGAAGTDFGYDPVALADFSALNIWDRAGNIAPDLRSVNPPVSRVFKGGSVITTGSATASTTAAVNAVSAVLMHDNIINEYVLDTATLSGTDWVVTMPTKRYYVPVASSTATTATAPFVRNFISTGACETVTLSYWDREEQTVTTTVDFSPPPPGGDPSSLCWESTVVTFNNANVLGSANSLNIPVNFQNGWARISFAQTYSSLAAAGNSPAGVHTYVGLPVTGFMVQDFVNGNVGGVLSNYGGNFNHKFTTLINGSSAE